MMTGRKNININGDSVHVREKKIKLFFFPFIAMMLFHFGFYLFLQFGDACVFHLQ